MEEWEIDFQWLKVRHTIKDIFGGDSLPDLRAILFLVGIQELGAVQETFSKEEKQDLMHIAVCSILEGDGYYRYVGRDEDGWPHYEVEIPFKTKGTKAQELILKKGIIEYFKINQIKSV